MRQTKRKYFLGKFMTEILIKVFIDNALQADQMVQEWKKETQDLSELKINIEIIDLITNPETRKKFGIVFSPTTIITLPKDRDVRFVGHTNSITKFLNAYNNQVESQDQKKLISEFKQISDEMQSSAQKMKEDLNKSIFTKDQK